MTSSDLLRTKTTSISLQSVNTQFKKLIRYVSTVDKYIIYLPADTFQMWDVFKVAECRIGR